MVCIQPLIKSGFLSFAKPFRGEFTFTFGEFTEEEGEPISLDDGQQEAEEESKEAEGEELGEGDWEEERGARVRAIRTTRTARIMNSRGANRTPGRENRRVTLFRPEPRGTTRRVRRGRENRRGSFRPEGEHTQEKGGDDEDNDDEVGAK